MVLLSSSTLVLINVLALCRDRAAMEPLIVCGRVNNLCTHIISQPGQLSLAIHLCEDTISTHKAQGTNRHTACNALAPAVVLQYELAIEINALTQSQKATRYRYVQYKNIRTRVLSTYFKQSPTFITGL